MEMSDGIFNLYQQLKFAGEISETNDFKQEPNKYGKQLHY
jgi:hypothetical protein